LIEGVERLLREDGIGKRGSWHVFLIGNLA